MKHQISRRTTPSIILIFDTEKRPADTDSRQSQNFFPIVVFIIWNLYGIFVYKHSYNLILTSYTSCHPFEAFAVIIQITEKTMATNAIPQISALQIAESANFSSLPRLSSIRSIKVSQDFEFIRVSDIGSVCFVCHRHFVFGCLPIPRTER